MQYVFSMTSRMVTIALGCALLLCVLLFALGVEIGARFVAPSEPPAMAVQTGSVATLVSAAPAASPAPTPTPFAAPADNQMSAASPASDSSTY
jgi:predicted lipid-binding transport protein (Tim44 family)